MHVQAGSLHALAGPGVVACSCLVSPDAVFVEGHRGPAFECISTLPPPGIALAWLSGRPGAPFHLSGASSEV